MANRVIFALFLILCPLQAYATAMQVAYYDTQPTISQVYPIALTSLARQATKLGFTTQVTHIVNFNDLAPYHLIYIESDDVHSWSSFSDEDVANMRTYLERGGHLYIDAGITNAFTESSSLYIQNSFPGYDPNPNVAAFLARLHIGYPEPLPLDSSMFTIYFNNLPPDQDLSPEIRNYVVQEKWPHGTYTFLQIKIHNHTAVLISPIAAMGWSVDEQDRFIGKISLRVEEPVAANAVPLEELATLQKTKVTQSQGVETVYFNSVRMPLWSQKPDGSWRALKYHQGLEIDTFAHAFYTQLGINLLLFSELTP